MAPRTEEAAAFWKMKGLPCWEQNVLTVISTPVLLVGKLVGIPWSIIANLIRPLGSLVILLMSLCWALLFAIIFALSTITESIPILRPVTFVIALPFILLGYFLISMNINVSSSIDDRLAFMERYELLNAFPWTRSLFRFYQSA